ncbi:MAG: hypothetical protein Q4G05_02410 [Clostridia bacterium]|nr:hypothetical protein [Clostridia bacterium]
MIEFIWSIIFWVCFLYGLIEIVKGVFFSIYTKSKNQGIHIIIAVKNQENKIEGFFRNVMFNFLYKKEESIDKVLVVDLGSTDDTQKILRKLQEEYNNLLLLNWRECKEYIERIEKD